MNEEITTFRNEAKNINKYFPELNYCENEQGLPEVVGNLALKDEEGALIDSYLIKIIPGEAYPYRFPKVFETRGRIPINTDWHVFPDGYCCIKTIPEEILLCKKGISLHWFIKEQVIPYFFNQKHRELHGYFKHERSHGLIGIMEYFHELFNTLDLYLILQFFFLAQKNKELKGDEKCLCGSGKKFRKCHRKALRTISVFSQREIEFFIDKISYMINTSL